MTYGWKFWVDHQPWNGNEYTLRIVRDFGLGDREAISGFTMAKVGRGGDVPVIATHSREEGEDGVRSFLQAALDAAWEIGLRPAAYEDNRLEVVTLKGWLEDMRVLAKVCP